MAFVLDKVSEDTFYENILLGLTKILDKNPRIKYIQLERRQACPGVEVAAWEQLHRVHLPKDMKDFYIAVNGFKLTWNYVFSDQETVPVGLLQINSLSDLALMTGLQTSSTAEIKINNNRLHLMLDHESKVFPLCDIDDTSAVCVVYVTPKTAPSIWLLDADLNWHYLANGFKKYWCMAIAHLGLPLWQFCFTIQGIPAWVEQMFLMIAPHLPVALPNEYENGSVSGTTIKDLHNFHINKLDTHLFKPKRRVSEKSLDILKYRKKH